MIISLSVNRRNVVRVALRLCAVRAAHVKGRWDELKCGTNGLSRGALLNAPRRVLILFLFFVSIHSLPSIRYFLLSFIIPLCVFWLFSSAGLISSPLNCVYSTLEAFYCNLKKRRAAFQKEKKNKVAWASTLERNMSTTNGSERYGHHSVLITGKREREKIKADEGYYTSLCGVTPARLYYRHIKRKRFFSFHYRLPFACYIWLFCLFSADYFLFSLCYL